MQRPSTVLCRCTEHVSLCSYLLLCDGCSRMGGLGNAIVKWSACCLHTFQFPLEQETYQFALVPPHFFVPSPLFSSLWSGRRTSLSRQTLSTCSCSTPPSLTVRGGRCGDVWGCVGDFVYMLMFNATVINGAGREEYIGQDWGPPALGGGGGRAARVKGSPEAAGREV